MGESDDSSTVTQVKFYDYKHYQFRYSRSRCECTCTKFRGCIGYRITTGITESLATRNTAQYIAARNACLGCLAYCTSRDGMTRRMCAVRYNVTRRVPFKHDSDYRCSRPVCIGDEQLSILRLTCTVWPCLKWPCAHARS